MFKVRDVVAYPLGVDPTIYDNMSNVDILWAKFSRHTLCQRSQSVFGTGESGESGATANACGRAGKHNRAALASKHIARRLAATEKACVTGYFPDFEKLFAIGLQQPHRDVGTDVKHHNVYFTNARFDRGEELFYGIFAARIATKIERGSAISGKFSDQCVELFAMASGVNPFWENLRMMALPMASPAPIISATLVFFGMAIDIRWGLYSQGYVYRD
jgi:hypothetical protein